jgi:hypothetical protein
MCAQVSLLVKDLNAGVGPLAAAVAQIVATVLGLALALTRAVSVKLDPVCTTPPFAHSCRTTWRITHSRIAVLCCLCEGRRRDRVGTAGAPSRL